MEGASIYIAEATATAKVARPKFATTAGVEAVSLVEGRDDGAVIANHDEARDDEEVGNVVGGVILSAAMWDKVNDDITTASFATASKYDGAEEEEDESLMKGVGDALKGLMNQVFVCGATTEVVEAVNCDDAATSVMSKIVSHGSTRDDIKIHEVPPVAERKDGEDQARKISTSVSFKFSDILEEKDQLLEEIRDTLKDLMREGVARPTGSIPLNVPSMSSTRASNYDGVEEEEESMVSRSVVSFKTNNTEGQGSMMSRSMVSFKINNTEEEELLMSRSMVSFKTINTEDEEKEPLTKEVGDALKDLMKNGPSDTINELGETVSRGITAWHLVTCRC